MDKQKMCRETRGTEGKQGNNKGYIGKGRWKQGQTGVHRETQRLHRGKTKIIRENKIN